MTTLIWAALLAGASALAGPAIPLLGPKAPPQSAITQPQDGPRFLAKSPFDMGTMRAGSKRTFELPYTNAGTAPLVVMDIKAQCGCTVAKFSKKPLAPGDTASVTVTYKPGRNKGFNMKTLTLFTNEPGDPRYMSFRVLVE